MGEKYQYRSEASVVDLPRGVKATDIPNGVVLRGPTGAALLVDYDDEGKMAESGTEVEIGSWLSCVKGAIPVDMVILVHSVRGEGQILLKSLEVNRLLRGGKTLAVNEAAKEGVLPQFVETLYKKYMEGHVRKAKKCTAG